MDLAGIQYSYGTDQHISRRILRPEGQVEGMGRCSLLLPTPHMMADVHTFCKEMERGGRVRRGRRGCKSYDSNRKGGEQKLNFNRRRGGAKVKF